MNQHYKAATEANGFTVEEQQLEATLALAYEQHTANLIAFTHLAVADGTTSESMSDLYHSILVRLGLRTESENSK